MIFIVDLPNSGDHDLRRIISRAPLRKASNLHRRPIRPVESVAIVGMTILSGRLKVRRGITVIAACFLVFCGKLCPERGATCIMAALGKYLYPSSVVLTIAPVDEFTYCEIGFSLASTIRRAKPSRAAGAPGALRPAA